MTSTATATATRTERTKQSDAFDQFNTAFVRAAVKSHSTVHNYASPHLESYEHFLKHSLAHIIKEHSVLTFVCEKKQETHVITFGHVTVVVPNHTEEDGTVREVLPNECRIRRLTYQAPVLVDVTHVIYDTPLDETTTTTDTNSTPPLPTGPPRETYSYREVPLMEVPVMVRSSVCHLSRSPLKGSECPLDQGGYFIIQGVERMIQMQESLRTNVPFVFAIRQPNKNLFTCEIRSCHESKMRSTSTLRVSITASKGGIPPEIVMALPYMTNDIPIICIIRLLGFENVDEIVYMVLNTLELRNKMEPLLRAVLNHVTNDIPVNELYNWIARGNRQTPGNPTVSKQKRYIAHLLENEFLPQLGFVNTDSVRTNKVLFLATIIRRLLNAYMHTTGADNAHSSTSRKSFLQKHVEGCPEVDDRDHCCNKRILLPGIMLSLLFRQLFRKFIKQLRMYLFRAVAPPGDHSKGACLNLNIAEAIQNKKITAQLRIAFSGRWSAHRNNSTHTPVTQVLNRMNAWGTESQMRRVCTPMCKEGKATDVRQLHNSSWGIFCPSETPEGASCGLMKNLANFAYVRIGYKSNLLLPLLHCLGMKEYIPADAVSSTPKHFVSINGNIVGLVTDTEAETFVKDVRQARRSAVIPFDTSISLRNGCVIVTCDVGCCMRPVVVVERIHHIATVLEQVRVNPSNHLWTLLVQTGVVEYIDKDEERELCIAVTKEEYLATPTQYTHIELLPSCILGTCASLIPFSERNQAPRNTYQSAMMKQAIAVVNMVHHTRFDTQMHIPHYTQYAITRTMYEEMSDFNQLSVGSNAIVAIMAYTGFNQEDSIIVNRGAVDRGLFRSLHYKCEIEEEMSLGGETEQFENPSKYGDKILGLKHANYDKLEDDGIVAVGTRVEWGDVLVGKTVMTNSVKRDRSLVFFQHEAHFVDAVVRTMNRDGLPMARIKLRSERTPVVGDKLCMTTDHDVLTQDGWKSFKQLEITDRVASLSSTNVLTATLVFAPIVSILEYYVQHDAPLVHIYSDTVDQLVTPAHKVPVCFTNTQQRWHYTTAQVLTGTRPYVLKVAGSGIENQIEKERLRNVLNCLLMDIDNTVDISESTMLKALFNYVQTIAPRCGQGYDVLLSNNKNTYYHAQVAQQTSAGVSQCNVTSVHANDVNATSVWCLELDNPTHCMLVRRNGKCSWTGNSSRHGQKGTIGLILPPEDMPFSMQTGMSPDLIISPHAIPSRMTLGQLLETVVSKTGAMLGKYVDGTAFQNVSTSTLCDHLHSVGFERFGNERLVNGMTGELLEASVFMGPVFYQRLKHMVQDKVHARTNGPLTIISRQPVEGRSRQGGLRFGEMERDCLVAHGCASSLQSQLGDDSFETPMCCKCGGLAIPAALDKSRPAWCKACNTTDVAIQHVPYAYKVLVQELSGIHINVAHKA